jgi:hypothetical protein
VNELQLLDELVPPFSGEPADWADVLHRARRRRRPPRRLVLGVAGGVAALAAASAVAVPLLRTDAPKLPSAADRKNVLVVMQPKTGRIVIEAAPWKAHDGICYLFFGRSAGCASRGGRKTMILQTPGYVLPSGKKGSALWGYTFDRRVESAEIVRSDGSHRRVPLHRFGGRLRVTFIGPVAVVPRAGAAVRLYDRAGRRITRR